MSWILDAPFRPSSISITTTTAFSDDLEIINIDDETYEIVEVSDF